MGLGSCSRARPGRSTATVRNQLRPTARTQLACASLRAAVYTTTSPLFLALHSPRSPFSPSSSLCRPLPDLSRALRPSTSATPAPFPLGLPSRLAPRILFSVRGSSSYPAVRYICRRTVLSLLRTPYTRRVFMLGRGCVQKHVACFPTFPTSRVYNRLQTDR